MRGSVPIPRAREELIALAGRLRDEAERLELMAEGMKRRQRVTQAAVRSRPATPGLAARIRRYAKAHPDASQQRIAEEFGVNPGRVSEAMHGDL